MFAPTRRRCISTFSTFLANCVLHVAHVTSIQSPFGVLLLGGVVLRLVSLPLTIYADQHLSRVANAAPQLRAAWHQYNAMMSVPVLSTWDRKLAARKLLDERARIFREHHTESWWPSLAHFSGTLASLYLVCVPAAQLSRFLVAQAGGVPVTSPLAVALVATDGTTAGGVLPVALQSLLTTSPSTSVLAVLDPTLSLAVGLALYNVWVWLHAGTGFSVSRDAVMAQFTRYACVGYGIAALLALVTPSSLAYLGPVCLGMAMTTTVKNVLGLRTAPGRALLRVADRPSTHGVYDYGVGDEPSVAAQMRSVDDALLGVTPEQRVMEWKYHKKFIESECNVRLNKLLWRIGLFDDVDEVEYEVKKTQRKRDLARERRQRGSCHAESGAATQAVKDDDFVMFTNQNEQFSATIEQLEEMQRERNRFILSGLPPEERAVYAEQIERREEKGTGP